MNWYATLDDIKFYLDINKQSFSLLYGKRTKYVFSKIGITNREVHFTWSK